MALNTPELGHFLIWAPSEIVQGSKPRREKIQSLPSPQGRSTQKRTGVALSAGPKAGIYSYKVRDLPAGPTCSKLLWKKDIFSVGDK